MLFATAVIGASDPIKAFLVSVHTTFESLQIITSHQQQPANDSHFSYFPKCCNTENFTSLQ